MRVTILQGLQDREEVVRLLDSNEGMYFLLEGGQPLYQFIDELHLEGRLLARLQIAEEVVFSCPAYVQTSLHKQPVSCLSDVVCLYEENGEYSLVVDTEDYDFVSHVMQQIIYLDLPIRVAIAREEEDARRIRSFLHRAEGLQEMIDSAESYIQGAMSPSEENGEGYAHLLQKLSQRFKQVSSQTLHVAVMGTKKAGKSVVVNSLLGDAYAPASVELPTSTACLYKATDDACITVAQGHEKLVFKDASAVHAHMTRQFKLAQFDAELTEEQKEITIHYPVRTEQMKRYTIVDTPGPDFAGARHKEPAYRWIRQADIILFVVDYAKHLTASEEQYLQDIKKQFEQCGKFYSLLIVVNKLDEMYRSPEAKSTVRFLDYLRRRLQELGYKGFSIMGVSALSYLLSVQAPKIPGCERLVTENQHELQNAFRDCRALYRGKPEMTTISFLRSQMDHLLDFFSIEATLRTVQEKSNVPRLIEYTDYIAGQKATVEAYKQHLFEIDFLSAQLQNKLQQDLLNSLSMHKGRIQEAYTGITAKAQEMSQYMQGMELQIVEKALIENIRKVYVELLEKTEAQLLEKVEKEAAVQVQRFLEGLIAWKADDLQSKIFNNEFLRQEILPLLNLERIGKLSEEFYEKQLRVVQQKLQEKLKHKESELQEGIGAFRQIVQELSSFINKEYEAVDMKIVVPSLEPSFYEPVSLAGAALLLDPKVIAKTIENHIVEKGFFKKLLSLLLFKREKHDLHADSLVNDLQTEVKEHASKRLKELHGAILSRLDAQFKQLQQRMYEEVQRVLQAYKAMFASIHQDMDAKKEQMQQGIEAVEQQMELARYLEHCLADYFAAWHAISSASAEQQETQEDDEQTQQEAEAAEEVELQPQ
ncbi:dynamin family protein [Ectobacillus ponti]|uniref:Dynamin family protein n=1 Tax=Ectobacillus ponti TaxID=2961894 RepID=A0AA41X2G4_9BACI|nr:dynamin family protein [Ectobacillus ponti]MCP8967492.1 dynamin family protein [Ectobacillus ponti]